MISRVANDSSGVPTDFSAELFFDGGVSASLYCSFINFRQQWVNVSGTKGYLQISDFVNPFYGGEPAFEVNLKKSQRGCNSFARVSQQFRLNGNPTRRKRICSAISRTRFFPANSMTTGRWGR